MRIVIGLVAAVVLAAGCASTPNLTYFTWARQEYKFSTQDRIMLALPDNPSDLEQQSLQMVREAALASRLKLVDSLPDAGRLMTYHITPHVPMITRTTSVGITQNVFTSDLELNRKNLENRVDSGYTRVTFAVLDVEGIKTGKRQAAWEALIYAEDDDFQNYSQEILSRPLKNYGRKMSKGEVFHPGQKIH